MRGGIGGLVERFAPTGTEGVVSGQPAPPAEAGGREDVLRRCLEVLGRRPSGLITDIDGTISAIAPRPTDAIVEPGVREVLRRLARRLDLVAVVTGRSARDGQAMVGVPEVIYIGNHGLERRTGETAWDHPLAVAAVGAIAETLRRVHEEAMAAGIDEGLVFENKRLTASIHYRLAPDPATVREVLAPLVAGAAAQHGLRVTEGRMVIEVRPELVVNKGTALQDLVEERGLRGVLFLGDDVTDVDAFRVVRRLREARGIAGLRVVVRAPETQPIVLTEADVTVDGVPACVELLAAISGALEASPSPVLGRSEGSGE